MAPETNSDRPAWRGINHLALVTDDMDTTVRFWHGVLGAEIIATVGAPGFRHYFFRIGTGQSVAFFEYADAELETFMKPAGIPYPPGASQFDHLSLNLADEEALEDLRRRLKAFGCEVTEVVDHGFIRSIYFNDPTGIALEASYWTHGEPADGDTVDHTDDSWFGDADPVPALREVMDHGTVDATPATRLTDDIVTPAPHA
ncbi:MAG: VOC family protein [Acidimicrobiales bacterium]|nr:VOC family protein [Acidimicrobiales bacterium]